MSTRTILVASAAFLFALAAVEVLAQEGVNRCRNASGKIVYLDRPCATQGLEQLGVVKGTASSKGATVPPQQSPGVGNVIDFGGGDSVRMVGQADNFDCDDPAFQAVKKVETSTITFADGTRKRLCKLASPGPAAPRPSDSVRVPTISGRSYSVPPPENATGRSRAMEGRRD